MKKLMRRLALLAVAAGAVGLVPHGAFAYTSVARTIPGGFEIVRAVDPGQLNCTTTDEDGNVVRNDTAADSWGPATATINNPCDVAIFFDQPFDTDAVSFAVSGPGGAITDWSKSTADLQNSNDLRRVPGDDTLILTPPAALAPGDYIVHVETDGVDAAIRSPGHLCEVPDDPNTTDIDESQTVNLGCYNLTFTVAPIPQTPVVQAASTSDHRDYIVDGVAEPGSEVTVLSGSTPIGTAFADASGDFHVPASLSSGSNTIKADAKAAPRTTEEKIGLERVPVASSAPATIVATVPADTTVPSMTVTSEQFGAASVGTAVQDPAGLALESDNAEVSGVAEDNDEVASFTATVVNVVTGETIAPGDDTYRIDEELGPFASWTVHFIGVDPGEYTVTVVAHDAAGNSSEASDGAINILVVTGDALD